MLFSEDTLLGTVLKLFFCIFVDKKISSWTDSATQKYSKVLLLRPTKIMTNPLLRPPFIWSQMAPFGVVRSHYLDQFDVKTTFWWFQRWPYQRNTTVSCLVVKTEESACTHIHSWFSQNCKDKIRHYKTRLEREENNKRQQLKILRKTHETQLQEKEQLVDNLQAIIVEQDERIKELEEHGKVGV